MENESDQIFTIRYWNGKKPTAYELADELIRIAGMLNNDFTSGEAMIQEDLGTGSWSIQNIEIE